MEGCGTAMTVAIGIDARLDGSELEVRPCGGCVSLARGSDEAGESLDLDTSAAFLWAWTSPPFLKSLPKSFFAPPRFSRWPVEATGSVIPPRLPKRSKLDRLGPDGDGGA
jgi:hypothetical protein